MSKERESWSATAQSVPLMFLTLQSCGGMNLGLGLGNGLRGSTWCHRKLVWSYNRFEYTSQVLLNEFWYWYGRDPTQMTFQDTILKRLLEKRGQIPVLGSCFTLCVSINFLYNVVKKNPYHSMINISSVSYLSHKVTHSNINFISLKV